MVVPSLIYKTGGAAVIPAISDTGKNKARSIEIHYYACMYMYRSTTCRSSAVMYTVLLSCSILF